MLKVINCFIICAVLNTSLYKSKSILPFNRTPAVRKLYSRLFHVRFMKSNLALSGFGGLEIACWPLVPKFLGFKPGRSRRIFQGEKILSTPSFGGEVKPSVSCRRFTACERFLNATWKSGISGKIHRPFLAHIVPPLATRISGETTSGESWNV